jgi:nucleoside-diphosphate-sugar epimerase
MINEKISIFGGSGFIGYRFIELFSDLCVPIDREENKPKTKNILYLISTVDNYNVHTNPYLDINTNLIKLIQVLEECKNLKDQITFNFISSWFVYGKIRSLPAREEDLCNPTGFYSITKFAAEKLLASYCETHKINYRILRLCNIIGNGDKKVSKKKNALQYLLNRVIMGESLDLYDGGCAIRDYMHVDDCCRAIKTCMEKGEMNTIYNISNSSPVQIKNIIEYAINKTNSKSKINNIPTPEFHKIVQVENMCLDNSKLLSIGYRPSISVYDTVDQILENMNGHNNKQ